MKKILMLSILLFPILSFSQTNKFSEEWEFIDSLEIEGRIETADSLVLQIASKSKRKKDFSNFIKSKIYHYKFRQIVQENSNQYVLDDLNRAIQDLPNPYQNILLCYKGKFLLNYYQENRWQIRRRTKIENQSSQEIETWSLETLRDTIQTAFDHSLKNEKKLKKTEVGEIAALIDPDVLHRKYKPTLFDLISQQALNFYNNSSNFPSVHPVNKDIFQNKKLFADTEVFGDLSFPESYSEHPKIKSLRIFQKLENFHRDDNNTDASVYWQLERLEYINTFYLNEEKWPLYLKALDALADKHKNDEINAIILFQKAEIFYDRSTEKQEDTLVNPDFLKKAVVLSEEIIKTYPNSASSLEANALIKSIKNPRLTAKASEILNPQQAGRVFLSYKSLDTINLKIYKVPFSFGQNLTYSGKDSLVTNLVNTPPLFKKTIKLPKSEDFNWHSTELLIPALEAGFYFVHISNGGIGKSGYSYSFFQVTNIVVTETFLGKKKIYETLNRTTGEKLANVKLELIKNQDKVARTFHTDSEGTVTKWKDYNNFGLMYATKDGDTLKTSIGRYHYYSDDGDDEQPPMAGTILYLDRAIYRPGQKVYFKGILLQREKNKTTTIPNEYVEIYVEDANGDEIEYFRLKTNKFGSFNSEFILPTSGITGTFRIYTEEDIDSETKFWDKIWDDGDYYNWGVSFNVEEYKRPTFEVVFDESKETFKLNDSITISGKVSSFMGATLSNLPLEYEIRRKEQFYSWRYRPGPEISVVIDTIKTDSEGNFNITFFAEADEKALENENLVYIYTIDAVVTDVNGETRSASTSVKIGNKNLVANLSIPENIKVGDSLKTSLSATNLNGSKIPVSGTLKIYKLEAPDRILRERLWDAPEIQMISEEKFKKLFPEEPYTTIKPADEWPKDQLMKTLVFENEKDFHESSISVSENWKSGKYIVEAIVGDGKEMDSISKVFTLTNPTDKLLPDNGRFSTSILNTEFAEDGFIKTLVQTGYSDLKLKVSAYAGYENIFEEFYSIDGSETITIPLKNVATKEVQIQYSAVKNNSLIHEEKQVSLMLEQGSLRIETETFRNKISPGQEETWSFKISDESGATPETEILASMYDASLDLFKKEDWRLDADFYYDRIDFPNFEVSNIGKTDRFRDFFSYHSRYIARKWRFDQLKMFGFNYSEPNSYYYRRYLSNLAYKEKSLSNDLVGNTRGRVTDDTGMPLPGVNVVIKGSSTGTQTNFDGEFALDTKQGDVLVFSFLGMITAEFSVGEKKEIFIILEPDSANLDAVVVSALGIKRKESDVVQALTGKVSGLQIEYADDDNNDGTRIIFRGNRSISGGDEPLIIVDGKMVSNLDIPAEDVLSTSVLKGAEGAALYGSQGANGVIVITTKKGLTELNSVQARTNLDETAFFFPNLTLDKDGRVKFSFTSPEALTQWKLRLFAHTNDWKTGYLEKTTVTQKELNLLPNPPRFLREGDTVVFKTKISNLTDETITGNSVLYLFDALNMQPIDTILANTENLKPFSIKAKGNTSVSWELIVPEGIQAVQYRILAKAGNFSDGVENLLPVLTNRMLVKESLPLFVRAGETKTFEFENLENNTSPTLDNHLFALEYSSNPAWYAIQSLPYLMEFEHECSEQMFARLYANSLAEHIMNSQPKIKEVFQEWKKDSLIGKLEKNEDLKSLILAETPWVRDAASETERKNRLANLFELEKLANQKEDILNRLEMMQNGSGAFPWFSGGRDNQFITQHILSGFGHLKKLGVDVSASHIIEKMISYLDANLLEREEKYKQRFENPESFYRSIYNVHYLYARSFFLKDFPLSEKVKSITNKIIEAQKEDWREKSLYNKGLLALIFSRMNEKETAKNILASLEGTAVKSETHGMYWKENERSWYWYTAPIETQALLIEAFSDFGYLEVVEEMKIWLLQNKRTNHWPTTKATTEACYALLMQGNDWLSVSDKTSIKVGGEPIPQAKLSETKKEAGTGYLRINWKAKEIDKTLANVTIENNNKTVGYGGIYWQYFEDLDKIETHDQGPLNVEKELYLNVKTDAGTILKQITTETPLKLGDLVTVRLVVRTTSDMDYIHLKDMRASGFEPTNVLSEYKYQDGTAYYESTKDAATHFFFDSLKKGTYVLEYTVRGNNSGNFSNGVTTIESMYAPEFSGHTKGIRVNILE